MNILQEWDLSGRCALITADSRGWTPFLAESLAEAGADVVVCGDDIDQINQSIDAIKSFGRSSMSHLVDLTSKNDIQSAVTKILSKFEKIDILVHQHANTKTKCNKLVS